MKEKELQKRVQALAAQAGEMGLFVDVFFTRIYSNGQAGTLHAACNHDDHRDKQDEEHSRAVWRTIASGMLRRASGEVPYDEKPSEHPVGEAGKA